MKSKIMAMLILLCLGCKFSDKNTTATQVKDVSYQKTNLVSLKVTDHFKERVAPSDYSKLTCDSLLILLIKSSSIDTMALSDRAGIDSIKKGVIYLTFTHLNKENNTEHNSYYLEVDLRKRELRRVAGNTDLLSFDPQLFDRIINNKCYNYDADYVTAHQ